MTKERIKFLADFFYSSNSSNDIPCRISLTTGQFSGINLDHKDNFITLINILNKSNNLKEDLEKFLADIYEL